jgi:hypothetical protein
LAVVALLVGQVTGLAVVALLAVVLFAPSSERVADAD